MGVRVQIPMSNCPPLPPCSQLFAHANVFHHSRDRRAPRVSIPPSFCNCIRIDVVCLVVLERLVVQVVQLLVSIALHLLRRRHQSLHDINFFVVCQQRCIRSPASVAPLRQIKAISNGHDIITEHGIIKAHDMTWQQASQCMVACSTHSASMRARGSTAVGRVSSTSAGRRCGVQKNKPEPAARRERKRERKREREQHPSVCTKSDRPLHQQTHAHTHTHTHRKHTHSTLAQHNAQIERAHTCPCNQSLPSNSRTCSSEFSPLRARYRT